MKNLDTIESARWVLGNDELVSAQAAPENRIQVQVVRYNPRTKSGKFHQYHDYCMPLEVFKLWRDDVDKAARTAKSPSHERD